MRKLLALILCLAICALFLTTGYGKDVLGLFLDELTREQRRAIEVVSPGVRSTSAVGATLVRHGAYPVGLSPKREALL